MYWCLFGVFLYGLESFLELVHMINGWSETNFRIWYFSGYMIGGAPLAQAYLYQLIKRKTANQIGMGLLIIMAIGFLTVMLSPIQEIYPSGEALSTFILTSRWTDVIPVIMNGFSTVFMIGGGIWATIKYFQRTDSPNLFWGNLLIASSAFLLVGGESFLFFGYDQFELISDLCSLICLVLAFRMIQGEMKSLLYTSPIS